MRLSIYISLVAILLTQFAFSQTDQGNLLLGGGIHFDKSEKKVDRKTLRNLVRSSKENTVYFNISPNIGYFVKEDLALGL